MKRTGIIAAALMTAVLVMVIALRGVCSAGEGQTPAIGGAGIISFFTDDDTQTTEMDPVSGILGEINAGNDPATSETPDFTPATSGNPDSGPATSDSNADIYDADPVTPDSESDGARTVLNDAAFLLVDIVGYSGDNTGSEEILSSMAYLVKSGDVVYAGGTSELEITILSADSSEVTFTANQGKWLSTSEAEDGEFAVRKGEIVLLWENAGEDADALSEYAFSLADVDIERVNNPEWFLWDIDLDGHEEQISFTYIDNGDEAPSVMVLEAFDEREDGETWTIELEGVYEISEVLVISGGTDNFLIVKTFDGDYYSHERKAEYVVVYENDSLNAYY